MKKKIKDLTVEELNSFCDKHYYSNKHGSCKNCPLCGCFYKDSNFGHCIVADDMGTMSKENLEKEVEVGTKGD